MLFSPPILLNILLACFWAVCTNAQNQTILPNCTLYCGGVHIPYPFGVGEGCYLHKGFEILCDRRNDSSTPFLGIIGYEVLQISLDRVRVKGFSTTNCYDKSGAAIGNVNSSASLLRGPFTLSNTQNKLYVIGCDIFAYITDYKTQKYITGCVSLCRGINVDALNSSCSGVGCCQTTIPKGLKAVNITVNSINTQRRSWAVNNDDCSYAALNDGYLNFLNQSATLGMISTAIQMTERSGLALDWAIGEGKCTDYKSPCPQKNSFCVDSTNGPGYRCNCSRGYEGNPYLPNGCRDIDECKRKNKCIDGATCINIPGSYYCNCAFNYEGDGKTDGNGCVPFFMVPSYKNRTRITVIFIGIGVGVGLLMLLIVGFWLHKEFRKRKHTKLKQRYFKQNGGLLLEQKVSSGDGVIEKTKIFITEELERATDNFNESRILGRGGSGTVYKGMLSDGRIVAIKKSKVVDESQIGQFINELIILSHINHRNVVKLFGCCLETEVPLLAYEFISNGTLSHHLHDEGNKSSISWENRLRIAVEVAGALSYLHSSASTPIFHRDIKSSNILLDENYRATISDFGISRSVPYEQTHLTTLVQGTFGYLDPEYFHSSQFTDKSDVYSFGVVLVELLTGEKPISFARCEEEKNLVMHFVTSVKENRVLQILETRILNEGNNADLLVVAKLAKRCLKLVGKKRPTMKEVATQLEGLRKLQEQECVPPHNDETNNSMYDWSNFSISGPESDDSRMITQGG